MLSWGVTNTKTSSTTSAFRISINKAIVKGNTVCPRNCYTAAITTAPNVGVAENLTVVDLNITSTDDISTSPAAAARFASLKICTTLQSEVSITGDYGFTRSDQSQHWLIERWALQN